MISSIIGAVLELSVTLVNYFVKDAERKRLLKEQMFRLVEKHSEDVARNVEIRKQYEELKRLAQERVDGKPPAA